MNFVTYAYFVFLAICLILYYVTPQKVKWLLLLTANLVFCFMLDIYSAIWLLSTSIITYLSAFIISKLQTKKKSRSAKAILVLSLIICFGALYLVKYRDFSLSLLPFGDQIGNYIPSIVMPVGISFYIFQVTGYLIDVYKKPEEFIKHIGHYIVSVTFFAKFIQGPIVPVQQFVSELKKPIALNALQMRKGALLILLGLFKKAVIADRLAVVVDTVFNAPGNANGLSTLIAIIFYAFQLYTDFAGYTDVAVGSALMFGINIPHNFKQPYMARSIADFWRRWHITLSTWFKNYIYIPLGGSRVHVVRWGINVLIVFLVSGLWHGAGLTFVVWGGLHGLYQIIGKATQKIRTPFKEKLMGKDTWLSTFTSIFCTFILACIAWTFFRASSLTEACQMLINVITGSKAFELNQLGIAMHELILSLCLILVTIVTDIISEHIALPDLIEKAVLPVRWLIYLILLFALILFGMYGSLAADSFIYVSF